MAGQPPGGGGRRRRRQSKGGEVVARMGDSRRHSSTSAPPARPGAMVATAASTGSPAILERRPVATAESLGAEEATGSSGADSATIGLAEPSSLPYSGDGGGDEGDNDKDRSPLARDLPEGDSGQGKITKTSTYPDCVSGGGGGAKCSQCHWVGEQRFCSTNGVAAGSARTGCKGSLSSELQSSGSPTLSYPAGGAPAPAEAAETDYECRQQRLSVDLGGESGNKLGGHNQQQQQQGQHSSSGGGPHESNNSSICIDVQLEDCCEDCCTCGGGGGAGQSGDAARPIGDGNHELAAPQAPEQVSWPVGGVRCAPEVDHKLAGSNFQASQIRLNERGMVSAELVGPPPGETGQSMEAAAAGRGFFHPMRRLFRLRSSDSSYRYMAEHQDRPPVMMGTGCAACAENHPAINHLHDDDDGMVDIQAGQEENTNDSNTGMAIAASTAAIAVTTVRQPAPPQQHHQQQHNQPPPLVTANSVQMAAEGLESKRERKAAKTLAIITGVFVMCWLPFFVMAITMSLLNLRPHKYVFALMLWLGYANSMLNPIIYTIFSPDFRKAFKRLLCGLDSRTERRRKDRRQYRLDHSNHHSALGASSSSFDVGGKKRGCLVQVRQQIYRLPPMFVQCCLSSSVLAKASRGQQQQQQQQQQSSGHGKNYVLSSSTNNTTSGSSSNNNNNNNNLRNHLLNFCEPNKIISTTTTTTTTTTDANDNNSRYGQQSSGASPSALTMITHGNYNPGTGKTDTRHCIVQPETSTSSQAEDEKTSSTPSHNNNNNNKQLAKEHGNSKQSPGRPQSSNIINDF